MAATTYNFMNGSVQGTRAVVQPVLEPGVITPIKAYVDFTQQAIDAGEGDIAQVIQIPAGTWVIDCFMRVITAEGADATCSLGYGSDADYWGRALNLDVTGAAKTLLTADATWDAGSIADGDEEAKDVTVAGAALGDRVFAVASIDVADLAIVASVTAEDTVTCQLLNNTGGAINLASMTVTVYVDKSNLKASPLYFASTDTIDITATTTNGDVDIDGAQVEVIATCLRYNYA